MGKEKYPKGILLFNFFLKGQAKLERTSEGSEKQSFSLSPPPL
jgi:hypothetical protein